jgi:hypothetical protein
MPFPIDEKYIKETEVKLHVNFPDSFRKKNDERKWRCDNTWR